MLRNGGTRHSATALKSTAVYEYEPWSLNARKMQESVLGIGIGHVRRSADGRRVGRRDLCALAWRSSPVTGTVTARNRRRIMTKESSFFHFHHQIMTAE